MIYVHSTSEPFTPQEVEDISAKAIVISPSIRGEVPEEVIDTLRAKNMRIALDVQGFIRIQQDGKLIHADWPEKRVFWLRWMS